MKNWKQLTQSRRSTRDFLDSPIEPGVLTEILSDGLTAPSWSNTRPFVVAVAEGEQRDRISQRLVARLRESTETSKPRSQAGLYHTRFPIPRGLRSEARPLVRAFTTHSALTEKTRPQDLASWSENYEFFGAPTALFFFTHRGLDQFGTLDLGLFMENVMLAANAKGLGDLCPGVPGWDTRTLFALNSKLAMTTH